MFVNIFNRPKTLCGQISINKQLRHVGILDIMALYFYDVACSRYTFSFKRKKTYRKNL